MDSLANVETVEPTFVEETATATESGFPFTLPKKLERTTVEPRYYGESKVTPKQYTSPEYRDPKPVDPKKLRKNAPVLFTSHYFSPLPKKLNGKKLKASKSKKGRKLVPFRHTVQTPTGLKLAKNGFTQAELMDGRLPNKYDIPSENMKKTRAPAAQVSLLEVDTTEQMAETETENEAVPPPFQEIEAGEHAAVVVAEANQFYNEQFTAPTWADEEATSDEAAAADEDVQTAEVEVDSELAHYNELESFLSEAEAATSSFVEIDESEEEEEEAEDESEEESEEEEESEDESEEEEEEEAEDESEEEEENPESQEFSLLEETGSADAIDMEMDEMAVNEQAAKQIDMDASSDEAAMTVADADEDSSAAEADSDEEEVADEDEAIEEAAELAETDDASALIEADGESEGVDTLLAEVDSEVSSDSDSETETEGEVEAEAETGKGTPGSSIMPGQTWEQMQNARLDAMEAAMEAEKAATPKVAATVVASKAELNAQTENTQQPEYNSEAEHVETVEPEILVQTAQTVLAEKIAQLKAKRQ